MDPIRNTNQTSCNYSSMNELTHKTNKQIQKAIRGKCPQTLKVVSILPDEAKAMLGLFCL